MAGMYAFFGTQDSARIIAAAGRLKFFEEQIRIVSVPGFSAAWVGHDDASLFGPASDANTGVTVITSGRVAWEESDWSRAEQLTHFSGGLSNRLLLERYLRDGARALDRHNGPAAVLVWDPRGRIAHLWTDHLGYHPLFLYRPNTPDATVVATLPDAIADDPAVAVTRDYVAMAEFLSAWRVTPPHTYYREVKYAGSAVHCTWNISDGSYSRREYWRPYQETPFPDIESAAEQLASAVAHAVHIRTSPRLGPIVSYTSGGMDSRAVLFAAASRADMIGLNLYDAMNNEAAVARQLCDAAGVRYVGFARDREYYPRSIAEGTRLSGGMWSQEDNHYLGSRGVVEDLGARTVMTACTTDWLFKGYGLERRYQRILGRNLPVRALTSERVRAFLPNLPRPVPRAFAAEVEDRLEQHFAGTPSTLTSPADWLSMEDRRVRPACYAVSVSGQIMYRMFPYDTFLADVRVVDCYSRCQPQWKVNSDVWAKAVRRICSGGNHIEDANFGWRVGASRAAKLSAFAVGWMNRRLNRRHLKGSDDGPATTGSWPDLAWFPLHSVTLRELWRGTPIETREIISSAWGEDPWAKPLGDWAHAPNDLFRIVTLASHIDRRVASPGSALSTPAHSTLGLSALGSQK